MVDSTFAGAGSISNPLSFAEFRDLNPATVDADRLYYVIGCGFGNSVSAWQTDGVFMQPVWGDVSRVLVDAINEGQSLSSSGDFTLTNSGTGAGLLTTPDSSIPSGANWPMSSAFQTGSQAAGQSGFNTTLSYDTSLADQDFKFMFGLPALSNGTDTYTVYIGCGNFAVANIAAPANCVRLKYTHSLNNGNWTSEVIKSSGAAVTSNTGVAVVAATSLLVRLAIRNGVARFWVNGTLVATISSGLPSGNTERMQFGVAIASSASVNPKYMPFDFVRNRLFLHTPRNF